MKTEKARARRHAHTGIGQSGEGEECGREGVEQAGRET